MQHTAVGVVLVAALEVVFRVHGHIARGHIDILIVRDVDACRIVHLVIGSRSDGETRHGAFAMVKDCVHVGWKYRLVLVVHLNGRVRPP